MAHYDNTGTAAADVCVGEDEHGIWLAGAVRPTATDEQIHMLRASAVSGDWRPLGRGMELVAALAVNRPGFPITKAVTHDGELMYENTFSDDKDKVVAWAKRNAACAIENMQSSVRGVEERLAKVKGWLAEYEANLAKLNADYPEIPADA